MTARDSVLVTMVATIWGFNFVVIEWGMQGVPPLLFLAARFTLVVLPAALLVPRPQVAWRTLILVGGFMSLGQFALLYTSLDAGMPPGIAGLVLQAQVIFTIAIAAGALRERPTPAQTIGVALGTLGLLIVALGREAGTPMVALALCLAAALSWAVGNVLARASKVPGGFSLTVWSAVVVPVPAGLLALFLDGPAAIAAGVHAFGWQAGLSTVYTAGIATIVGFGVFNSLLARNPPSAVVPWILLVPPVAMASAWACFGDTPNAAEMAGAVVLLAGVLIALRPTRPREPQQSA